MIGTESGDSFQSHYDYVPPVVFFPSSDTMTLLDELKQVGLDGCGYDNDIWPFCKLCYTDILRAKIPKISALNSVNVITCDDYPAVLKLQILPSPTSP